MQTPKGLAPGCSGLRAEHLKAVLCDRNLGLAAQALTLLTGFVNQSLNGYLPPDLQPCLCGGRLIPLIKKDSGVRPLVVGELLRALVSKCALSEVTHQLTQLQPHQLGVGKAGAVIPAAVQTVKSWIRSLTPGEALLIVDISNAYNSIDRAACLRGVEKYCPDLLRWAHWCLNGASNVIWDAMTIPCITGVQQGDPLAPLLFSVGLHGVVDELVDEFPELRHLFFFDDGIHKGSIPALRRCYFFLRNRHAQLGLSLNASKCELYGPTEPVEDFGNVQVVADRDAWTYLGAPLCEQTVKAVDSAHRRVVQATTAIATFGAKFPFQAQQLLRMTTGACKVEYLLQAMTSSSVVDELAARTSTLMRNALAAILKGSCEEIDDEAWATAALPLRMGGFGLRDHMAIALCARLAALVNVSDLAVEIGAEEAYLRLELDKAVSLYMSKLDLHVRPDLVPSKELQKQLTVPLHLHTHHHLLQIANPATKARLESLATPHATAWLACTPLFTVLAPDETVAAMRRSLGMKLHREHYCCPDCGCMADTQRRWTSP